LTNESVNARVRIFVSASACFLTGADWIHVNIRSLPADLEVLEEIGPRIRAGIRIVSALTIRSVRSLGKLAQGPPVTETFPPIRNSFFLGETFRTIASTGIIMKKRPE